MAKSWLTAAALAVPAVALLFGAVLLVTTAGATTNLTAELPLSARDTDQDGCADSEELGNDEALGGRRDPLDAWDFFDVTGDRSIDLADALDVLSFFGDVGTSPEADLRDREVPDDAQPWRTAAADDGIDLSDALVNLRSFGSLCTGPLASPGVQGVVPWAITHDTFASAGNGHLVTLEYDANNPSSANLLPIRIDGWGSVAYEAAATYGGDAILCAAGETWCSATQCPGTYPSMCAETSPDCDGPECLPQTGNLTGPTQDAVDFRMEHTSDTCDTFEEVYAGPAIDGTYEINTDCDPSGGGACATATSPCSRRVLILPVVDAFGNGADAVTIEGFVYFYLEGYASGGCSGSECEILGRFVNPTFVD